MSAKQRSTGRTFNHDANPGTRRANDSPTELGWFDWLAWFTGDKAGGSSALGGNPGHSSIKNYPRFTRAGNVKGLKS
jgi:hypothetical protein